MKYAVCHDGQGKVKLSDFPTEETTGLSRAEAEALTEQIGERMAHLQELLFAAGKHSLLIVLQGMDTSGKDGLIKRILQSVNVQSTDIVGFKVPTPDELAHDFLWRVHKHTPAKGEIVIFNRSHYEDVLVVRVHNLVPEDVWSKRYRHINHFEELLVDSGTIVLKFFLHISKDEQKHRLLEREKEAIKAWKLSVGDWQERQYWEDYQRAYEDAINKCSTKDAPWYIIPSDQKWFRNFAVFEAITHALEPYEPVWRQQLEQMGEKAKRELEEYRKTNPL